MKMEYTQKERDQIIDSGDNVFLTVNGLNYPARILGRKLDYPFISAVMPDGSSKDIEISWALAERLVKGDVKSVEC